MQLAIECVKQEHGLPSTKVAHSVEMDILYDFLEFMDKVKRHLKTVAPLRSQKRQEELINFYHSASSSRPESAVSSSSAIPVGTRGGRVPKAKSDIRSEGMALAQH